MKDIMGMMKKAQELQAKMGDMQDELAKTHVEGAAGAGMVAVTLTAKGEMVGIKIDPSLFAEDEVEMLEDLLIAAHNDARKKGETLMTEKMSEMTAGIPLPPGMKLPF